MKSSYLRAVIALLCAVILSACGGNNGSLALSGTITNETPGVTLPGMVLVNNGNGEKLTIEPGATSFIFTKLLATDEKFDVQIATPPTGAACTPISDTANTGTASVYTVYYLGFTCKFNPYILGGTVTGLTGTGLVLANGADTTAVLANGGADVKFTFPTKVANHAQYGVSVLTQPAGQTCTVDSALNPGTMPADSNQLGLIVNCK
ncbi:hypothetical protein GJ697_21220 [Pseudoduganella sp. FT25W]|uniref:Lipoprotein n=1 Tax=Duganella alba TaxID=2666081 RepID=A0A6L5QKW0_9BURK|nr:hypothetical protein [Duganella alba]MRX10359.1 hypothetical protein [Duganella alba]MRX17880.1 hypothetical protein [Duganella alba]